MSCGTFRVLLEQSTATMRTKFLWLVASVALLTSACQKDELIAPAGSVKSGGDLLTNNVVTGVQWALVSLPGEPAPMHDLGLFFMLAPTNNEVTGSTGCNQLTGQYRLAGDKLAFISMAHTRRFCPDVYVARMESRFMQVLGRTDSYIMGDGSLILMQAGQELARFKQRGS
jgi:heat shock protein HslJ